MVALVALVFEPKELLCSQSAPPALTVSCLLVVVTYLNATDVVSSAKSWELSVGLHTG